MKLKIVVLGVVLAAVAACSRPEPEPVYVQPLYDKTGNASCPAGYALSVLEQSGQTVCAPIQ